jgi:hypothetical protein
MEILLQKKDREIELVTKSRENTEKHVAFLVKEKDRLLTRAERAEQNAPGKPSTTLSTKHRYNEYVENIRPKAADTDPPGESWTEVQMLQ